MGGQRKSAGKRTTGQSSSSATTSDKDSGPQRHQRKSKPSDSETKSTRSKQTTSTTESGFQDIAFDNGILNPVNSKPPADLDYMQDDANRTRDTESPSESEYQKYVYKIQTARNEQTVLLQTSQLLKEYDGADSGYSKVYNHPFNTFPKNVGFNDGLSAAQPDMVEGLDMPEFDPFPVRQQLGGAAVVTSGSNATTLSHLAGEWKGPGKDMVEAQTQAAYDGATLVYGRNKARTFLGRPDPAGHSFVSTFTTDGTTVNTFAHYSSEANGQIKYHQYPITSTLLTSSFENFKTGRRQLRNTQDRAKNAAYTLRDELIEKWSENHQSPISPSVPAKTADSTDCNSYDYDGEDPNSQLLTEYWTSFSANNQDESFMQIPTADNAYAQPSASFPANNQDDPFMQISTADNGYTSPDALTFSLITPPQSSKDISLPLESSEDIDDSNVRGHGRTRRTRTRAADTVDGPREVDQKSNARKTRRKH
jgi:hypothetical protein